MNRRRFVGSGLYSLFLPFIRAGEAASVPPTEAQRFVVPNGYLALLDNPQAITDGAGVVFLATRPNSDVGGLVWKQLPDGRTEIVLPIDPSELYGLGELMVWADGYLRYVTISQGTRREIVVIPIPGWTPWITK